MTTAPNTLEQLATHDPEPEEENGASWQPLDLDDVLSDRWAPERPVVAARSDGVHLLYAGRSHHLAAETEAGKTWFGLACARSELEKGHVVVFLDYEDDAHGVVGRLRAMGVDIDLIRRNCLYVRPDCSVKQAGRELEDLLSRRPKLVVIDGVTEAMLLEDLDILDNQHVAEFNRRLVEPMARSGAAVLLLDHVVKNDTRRGRNPIGAVHKINSVTGAAFRLENLSSFGVGRTGSSKLSITKDRPGQLSRRAGPQRDRPLATLVVNSVDHDAAEVRIDPWRSEQDDAPDNSLQEAQAEVLAVLHEHPDGLKTKADIKARVHRRGQVVGAAINGLIDSGRLTASAPYRALEQVTS